MRWSAKLGRFAGIDVYVHATFFALLAYFAAVYWSQTGTLAGVLAGLSLIVMLFVCVLLHEYGHALTARRYGIATRYITLLPIGGIALLESMPREPRQEIVVALAGPAVNLAIAGATWLLIEAAGRPGSLLAAEVGRLDFLPSLLTANLALAVFNLIPAFPMDGGRVLRALLSMRMDRVRATRVAATVGQTLAVGLGLLGLYWNPVLILIAAFVWIGAGTEASAMEAEARLASQPAARAMMTSFAVLGPEEPLSRAVELTLAGAQKDFPVIEAGRLVGVLSQAGLLKALHERGAAGDVRSAMGRPLVADVSATLSELLGSLQGGEGRLVCLLSQGRLVGVVDLDNISEYLRIRAAMARR
ncbi:site-2 protease family protein [Amaricoccus sp.]|uniref:site-2 protease family protein n=1 Tax=Amaricoccus sp. TaxID=1872485 RepID=UPI001B5353DA|nr:site-2 protease family protein [Amaricoccus sp.]MBP7002232.1 site-2 protease family protein [Amaricoccus sp.]